MKYHDVKLKIADELRNKEQKHKQELKIAAGAIAGIGLFSINAANHEEHVANADNEIPIVSDANSDSVNSAQSQSAKPSDESSTQNSDDSSAASSATSSNNRASGVNTSNNSVANSSTATSSSSSSVSQADSSATPSNATIDSSANNDQTNVETAIQHVVTIKGTDGYEHPYVVSGSDGQTVTLPNGQSVKIAGNQLVDPTTNQPFNNNDTFDQGTYKPNYQNYTVQLRLQFVDQNNNPVAVNYNNYNPSGYQTYKVTLNGYDGEPFKLYYRDIIGNQFSGFTAQQIGNQNDANNGLYVEAILGHGVMNGNDPIILKNMPSYAKVRYYITTNDGSRRYFDTDEVQTGSDSQLVDVQTTFNNYNNGIKLSDYFTLPTDLSQYTFKYGTSKDQPGIVDVNLLAKPVTKTLKVLVRNAIDSNETYTGTITMIGSYGNKSNYVIQSNNIQFDGTNPLSDSSKNTFLSGNTNLVATIGADSSGANANYGSDKYLWQVENNIPNLSWDNPDTPATTTPVLYYIPVNTPYQVKVPNLVFNLRFWGPKNIDGSGYDPSNADNNLAGNPYNDDNENSTGLINGKNGAINYRTYYNWPVTSDKYAPVNTIYDVSQWSYPGFSNDGEKNHHLIQLTNDGPVPIYVDPTKSGTVIDNENESGDRKYIDLQNFSSLIPGHQAYTANGVAGYLIPKNTFGYSGPDSNGTVFYPARARVLSERSNGQLLVYHDGNYYYGDDTDFKNPIQFQTSGSSFKEISVNDNDAYYVGDINNYAQAHQITLKYLDTNSVDQTNPTISASGLPNSSTITSKQITAYTEDRIYYDQNQNAFFLERYGKVGQNGKINTDIDSTTIKLFDAPAGYNYDYNTQSNYANYNYHIDQSKFGGVSVANWIAGEDSTINLYITSNEMHPYGPDGTDNVAAVYMQSNGDKSHNAVVNLIYTNLTNGNQIAHDSRNVVYDPNNPSNLDDLTTYFPIIKSPYGTFIIKDSRIGDYKYVDHTFFTPLTNDNSLKSAYLFLLPFDPNDPNNQNTNTQPYPLNINYVDEQGNSIDDNSHDFHLTGVKSQTINEVMNANKVSSWDYGTEDYERVGVKLDLLNNDYYDNDKIDSLFNSDSSSNNNQIFGEHLNIYIVLRKQYVPNSGNPSGYPPSSVPSSGPSASSSVTSSAPSSAPSSEPSSVPSSVPSVPNSEPSSVPSSVPSVPNSEPSSVPSSVPSVPNSEPSSAPSSVPSVPNSEPSSAPSSEPSVPSSEPSSVPSTPSSAPSSVPSSGPSASSSVPSSLPSSEPSSVPSSEPSSGSSVSSYTPSSVPSGSSNSTSSSSSSNGSNAPSSTSSSSSSSSSSSTLSSTSSSSSSSGSNAPSSTSFSSSSSSSNTPSPNSEQDELPQTGETNHSIKYGLIGTALIALSGFLFGNDDKRKHRKK